jgi:hypothetical protein
MSTVNLGSRERDVMNCRRPNSRCLLGPTTFTCKTQKIHKPFQYNSAVAVEIVSWKGMDEL